MLSENLSGYHSSLPNRVTLDSAGRIVLPKAIREKLHLSTGDELTIQVHEGSLVLKSRAQALAEARAFFARLAPPDVVLSDELIAERRREAADD